jgi:hypothetical protein
VHTCRAIPTSRCKLALQLEPSASAPVRGKSEMVSAPTEGMGSSSSRTGAATLELRVAPGQRGPQVTEVISVDSSTAAPKAAAKNFRSQSDRKPFDTGAFGQRSWESDDV